MPPALRSREPIEVRRARGEVACAECRRHKLKCDRSIPCSTCIRKGCQEICPNGTLAGVQQPRRTQTPTDEETRQRKLTQMSKRIRQLEDALQISHSSVSTVSHPLLSEDLLDIKSLGEEPAEVKKESDDEDTVGSFGTLAVLGTGIESYVGTDALVIDRLSSAETIHLKVNPIIPPSISRASGTFPFTPLYLPTEEIQASIEQRLPSFERASALIEAYLENISWFSRAADREQIMEELIPEVYRRRRSTTTNGSNTSEPTHPHVLSLLLAVFACGAVADLTLSPWSEEADVYYNLAWTAISLKPVFDGAGIHVVQTIALLGSYDIFSCQKNSLEGTWKIISFCMSLASSIGLHRDPAHFKLPPKQVQRRRNLFWELYSLDMWRSIGSGRPIAFTMSVVDCEFPEDKDATLNEDGTRVPSLWHIRYRFASEVMAGIVEKLSSARPLKYSEILVFDQQIRDFGPQHVVNLAAANASASHAENASMTNLLKKCLLTLLKDASLLLLHRNFFVRALAENPLNPMRSHFAPSFLATYRSAANILRVIREQFDPCGHYLTRVWPIWAHALSATVMLGSVAAGGITSVLAPQAYLEFNLAFEMLTKVQMHPLVKEVMPMLLRLRDQAVQALMKSSDVAPEIRPLMVNLPPTREAEKEFNVVSGMGRLIRKGFEEGRLGHNAISRLIDELGPPASGSRRSICDQTTSESSRGLYDGIAIDCLPSRTVFATPERESRRSSSEGLDSPFVTQEGSRVPTSAIQATNATETAQAMDHTSASLAPSSPSRGSSEGGRHETVEQQILHGGHGMDVDFNSDSQLDNLTVNGQGEDQQIQQTTSCSTPDTPLNFDTLSTLSPNGVFNTDFDVSYNMRASTGEESVLPLLSDDMDVWRTILQDSRFFGIPAEMPNRAQEE